MTWMRKGGLAALVLMMVASFQNCGQQADHLHSVNSSQCRAQLKAEVAEHKMPAAQLQCADFNNYSCERRIFSPDIENMSHSLKECVANSSTCVDVDVRQYNTAAARAGAQPAQFEAGGDYNHEEVHCYHKQLVKGTAVFEGSGDSLEESLAGAMAACEKAEGT